MTITADRAAAGRAALHAPLETTDGRSARLEEHLADPLIVFMWASW